MYSISKETYEIMKEKCGDQFEHLLATGKLVPSKLTNRLMWIGENDADPIRDFGNDSAMLPILLDCQQSMCSPASDSTTDSCSGRSSVASWSSFCSGQGSSSEPTDSGSDKAKLSKVWETLRSIKDDCDFCKELSGQRGLYPKHTLYDEATGELACPVVLGRTCRKCGQKGHIVEFCKHLVQSVDITAPRKDKPHKTANKNRNANRNRMNRKY